MITDDELRSLRQPARVVQSAPGITDAQKGYITLLLDERVVDPKMGLSMEEIKERIPHLNRADASRWITRLKELPRRPAQPRPSLGGDGRQLTFPDVPQGRYAVEEKGEIKFFRVDRPTEGRWEGWTFLSIQASDELIPIRNPVRVHGILKSIAKDPLEASAAYGRHIGACGVCGRTLTNPDSRRRGIGPICAEKFGRL